ncbi:MAG: hypothetical protein GYA55_01790 [SAR324 cluster bacterium]|uniref:Uncharacterized protein n=1 Tax=SAR324 cluster bacterium TaxID=2024889 RepID=A0A7X9FPF6_9DELT|nr:hypothetical protein [SAR324 cluster bacterium]
MGDIVLSRRTRDLEGQLEQTEVVLQEMALKAICALSEQGQIDVLAYLANALKDCKNISVSAEVLDALRQIIGNGEENVERRANFSHSGGFCS